MLTENLMVGQNTFGWEKRKTDLICLAWLSDSSDLYASAGPRLNFCYVILLRAA